MGKLPAPFLLFVFSTLFTLIIPSAGGLSFNFTRFSPGDPDIKYEGNASSSDGAIQLTTNRRDANLNSSAGRATYNKSMQLWDKASGNLTDFTTHFSFSIDSQGETEYGDGLAFFLGPELLKSEVDSRTAQENRSTDCEKEINRSTAFNRSTACKGKINRSTAWPCLHQTVAG